MLAHIDQAPHDTEESFIEQCLEHRRAVAHLARVILELDQLVVIATSTTGFGPRGELIEFAAVDAGGCTVFHTLVRPLSPIPASATEIHGLTDAMVLDAPQLAQVWTPITHLLDQRPVAGYHIIVDQRVLRRSADQLAVPPRETVWLSIGDLYERWSGRTRACSIDTACRELSVEVQPAAPALQQARAALAILRVLSTVDH